MQTMKIVMEYYFYFFIHLTITLWLTWLLKNVISVKSEGIASYCGVVMKEIKKQGDRMSLKLRC